MMPRKSSRLRDIRLTNALIKIKQIQILTLPKSIHQHDPLAAVRLCLTVGKAGKSGHTGHISLIGDGNDFADRTRRSTVMCQSRIGF